MHNSANYCKPHRTPRWSLSLVLIALVAAASACLAASTAVWRWDTDGDLLGWQPANFESFEVSGGMFRGVTKWDCQLVSPPVSFDASAYKTLEFRASSSLTGSGELFYHGPGESFSEQKMVVHTLLATDEPRIYRIDLAHTPGWQGEITGLRLDLLDAAGAQVALDYVRLYGASGGFVPNFSFEDDLDGDGMPDGWKANAGTWKWSDQYAIEGDRAMMLQTGTAAGAEAALTVRVPLDPLGVFSLDASLTHLEGGKPRNVFARLRYYDVFGKPLADPPAIIESTPRGDGYAVAGQFEAPRLAASADLDLVVAGAGLKVWWDVVRMGYVGETVRPEDQPLESWRGSWIWATETAGKDNAPAYLRYDLDLATAPEMLEEARCEITADDTFELFVNGKPVADTTGIVNAWKTPRIVDLKPYLVQGRNAICVLAHNEASASGMIFEGVLIGGGKQLDLLSGSNWKAAGSAPADWTSPGFDDSAWPAAKVLAPSGSEPWGYVDYTYLGRREKVSLGRVEMPQEIAAGEALKVTALVTALPSSAGRLPLRFSLIRDGHEVVAQARRAADVASKSAGGVKIGPLTMPLSRFLPPGEYQVAFGFPYMQYGDTGSIVVGSLSVKPAAGPQATVLAEVREHNGLPTLFLSGKPDPFMHYIEQSPGRVRVDNMRSAGVHIILLNSDDIGWKGPNSFDYSQWDARVAEALTADPDAVVMPIFDLSGLGHTWWMLDPAHNSELCRTEDGSTNVGLYAAFGAIPSLASPQWRADSSAALLRFIKHCQGAAYASRVIGYHPCSGVSWEWQHWGSVDSTKPTDYSEPMRAAFGAWAQQHYGGDVAALRAAWKLPDVTFQTVKIPAVAQRDGADHFIFRNPSISGYVIDFYKFNQDVMVDGIEHYCHLAKAATGGKALTGTFYGYTATMLGGARRAGDSGHYALARLLESKDLDFLVSPFDYGNRALGDTTSVMSAVGSVLAHGKLFAMEADLRTHLVTDPSQRLHGSPEGLDGTIAQLKRAFASDTAKGLNTQWYDFSLGWITRDPRQAQVIKQLRDAAQKWVGWDRSFDPNSVAVVVDEQTPACYLGHQLPVMYQLVYRQKMIFERAGAPWNIYLLSDVTSSRLPKFKCYFFLNCFHMADAQREYITRELQGGGRTLVWFYAPGYVNDRDLDAARISELTGMNMVEEAQSRPWKVTLKDGNPLTAGVMPQDWQQPDTEIGPVFYPRPDGVQVAGTWEGSDLPGLAIRKADDWTSIYSAGPMLSVQMVKNVCQIAGVPVIVAGSDPSFVGPHFVGVHSAVARKAHLRFPVPTNVSELLSGAPLGRAVTELDVDIPGPGTVLLHTDPAK